MGRPRTCAGALVACLLLWTLSAPTASPDRASADFFVQRGEKALREKDLPTAQAQFRKAIAEDPTHLLAHAGLADTLLAAGEKGAGLLALREAVRVADATKDMPGAWVAAAARVRAKLASVDAASAALGKIVDGYVAALIELADRNVAKEPDTVAAILAEVRRIRPDDSRTKLIAERLAKVDTSSWVPLFNGKDKSGWDDVDTGSWWVTQGCLACNVPDPALIARSKTSFHGDFDVRMEAKFVKKYGESPGFGLMAVVKGDYDYSLFGIEIERVSWIESRTREDHETILGLMQSELPSPIDYSDWNVYEMRFHGEQMEAVLNGRVLRTLPRPKGREQGPVGLWVQTAHVLFRKIEARQH